MANNILVVKIALYLVTAYHVYEVVTFFLFHQGLSRNLITDHEEFMFCIKPQNFELTGQALNKK